MNRFRFESPSSFYPIHHFWYHLFRGTVPREVLRSHSELKLTFPKWIFLLFINCLQTGNIVFYFFEFIKNFIGIIILSMPLNPIRFLAAASSGFHGNARFVILLFPMFKLFRNSLIQSSCVKKVNKLFFPQAVR